MHVLVLLALASMIVVHGVFFVPPAPDADTGEAEWEEEAGAAQRPVSEAQAYVDAFCDG